MENTLELWKDLFTDPVAIYSAIGFIIMLGIGGFHHQVRAAQKVIINTSIYNQGS